MAEYIYPALFHPNNDGSYTVTYPDLPGCITEGKTLCNAMYMAQSALKQWLEYLTDKKMDIPAASDPTVVAIEGKEFVNLVGADIRNNHAVKRTVSIPKWMDDMVIDSGLSLSRVLQDALRDRLNISN